MAEIYNRTLVETKAAMLLIPKPAGVLANNRLDLYDTLLLTETWSVDNTGTLVGPQFSSVHSDLSWPEPHLRRDLGRGSPYSKKLSLILEIRIRDDSRYPLGPPKGQRSLPSDSLQRLLAR